MLRTHYAYGAISRHLRLLSGYYFSRFEPRLSPRKFKRFLANQQRLWNQVYINTQKRSSTPANEVVNPTLSAIFLFFSSKSVYLRLGRLRLYDSPEVRRSLLVSGVPSSQLCCTLTF